MKRVDLNGDGQDDFVLDVGSVNCDGAASVYGDRAIAWNARTRKFDYAPVATVRMIE